MRQDPEHLSLEPLIDIKRGDLVQVKNRARLWTSINTRSDKLYEPKENNCGVILGLHVMGYKVRFVLCMNDGDIIILSTRISSIHTNYEVLARFDAQTSKEHNS